MEEERRRRMSSEQESLIEASELRKGALAKAVSSQEQERNRRALAQLNQVSRSWNYGSAILPYGFDNLGVVMVPRDCKSTARLSACIATKLPYILSTLLSSAATMQSLGTLRPLQTFPCPMVGRRGVGRAAGEPGCSHLIGGRGVCVAASE